MDSSIKSNGQAAYNIYANATVNCLNTTNPLTNYNDYYRCKLGYYLNYTEFEYMFYVDGVEQDLFSMNMIFRIGFGIPGVVFAALVIWLILRTKELKTEFGMICVSIGFCDILIFFYMVFVELGYDIRFINMNNPYIVSNVNQDAPFMLLGTRIDRITYYLGASAMSTCVFYGTLKSYQRFLSLYAPLIYDRLVDMKRTIGFCIVTVIFVHLGFAPVLFIETIDIRYIYGRYLFGTANANALYKTSILVKFVREYIDYGNITLSIIFDILTAIKLYQFNRSPLVAWSKQRSSIEKLFLLQNMANVLTVILLFISYFMFVFVCNGGGLNCMNNFGRRFVRMVYNYDSSKVMWRCLDEFITLLFQCRAYRIYKHPSNSMMVASKTASI